ncbi:MAG: patatin-like phospholipase family protein [Acidobacteria bacterium]|nr:patatin-like phospholipase family protein [Acidobacteriota bacterium]
MPNSLDLPLHLYEVLEEEYRSLYNERLEPGPAEEICLQGEIVEAPPDFGFHRGHVKDPERLYKRLSDADDALSQHLLGALSNRLRAAPGPPEKPGAARERVSFAEVVSKLGAVGSGAAPQSPPEATDENEGACRAVLNALLRIKFYDADAFKYVTHGATTQKLVEQYDADEVGDAELVQFNRLLLEEVFYASVRRVADVRLAAMYQRLHRGRRRAGERRPHRQAALCLSGGGIRSGSFALGLMQGLARRNLLKEFDYLSTVSGGGYMGGWLTAWIHRHREGLGGVTRDLVNLDPLQKLDPDTQEIQFLRQYSNFLTPQTGLLSADSWTFIGIYVRNLLINWLVFAPFVFALLYVPRLCVAFVRSRPGAIRLFGWEPQPTRLSAGAWMPQQIEWSYRHLFLICGLLAISWVILYIRLNRPGRLEDLKSRWRWLGERASQRGFLKWCLTFFLAGGVLLTTYLAWTPHEKEWLAFVLFGIVATALAWLGATVVLRQFKPFELVLLVVAGIVGGFLLWVGAEKVVPPPNALTDVDVKWAAELYVCFAVPLFLVVFLLGVTAFAAFTSEMTKEFHDEDREWWARFGAWALICALAWGAFSSLVIFGPLALIAAPKLLASVGGAAGLVAALVGRSSKTNARGAREEKSTLASLGGSLLPLLAALFLAVVVAALSLLTSWIVKKLSGLCPSLRGGAHPPSAFALRACDATFDRFHAAASAEVLHMRIVHETPLWFAFAAVAALLVAGFLLSRVVNLNLFSLHAGYRNRLIRTFLGASRGERRRRPNPFTGFDPADNIHMHELRPALLREADFKDIRDFARELKKQRGAGAQPPAGPPDPPEKIIYDMLTDATRDLLSEYSGTAPPDQRLKVDLINDLNRLLEEADLCAALAPCPGSPPRFAPPPADGDEVARIHRNRTAFDGALSRYVLKSSYPPQRLFHVVNTSLNLVGGDNLAWQQRKAESFTVSPLHSGSSRVGYRRSKDYGGDDGISLGTAAAVSGAAASSNMGYYTTSPVLSLVMTLFNVRLGWWLGNPGPAGSKTYMRLPGQGSGARADGDRIYRLPAPLYSIQPVVAEAFGLTDDKSSYVYLTDGGHFENLALYEMVLRRCHLVVVADGAADPDYEFGDLANAVRKIRIDMGVSIEFLDMPIRRKRSKKKGERSSYWAVGRIRYGDVDQIRTSGKTERARDGILIYVKPAVYGDEPTDVVNYKESFPDFPHETTADQFFDEPQFESHRMLGYYAMEQICEALDERRRGAPDEDDDGCQPRRVADAQGNEPDERARAEFVRSACDYLRARLDSPPEERKEDFKWMGEVLAELDALAPPEGESPPA